MSITTLIKSLVAATLLASAAAHADAPRIEKLPRVVITGKAVAEVAQVAQLPRVVITGTAVRELAQLPRVVVLGTSEATAARRLFASAAQFNSAAKRG